jgi:hypothetical protein
LLESKGGDELSRLAIDINTAVENNEIEFIDAGF